MKRIDYYIFGLAAVNIFMFVQLASMVVSSTIASVVERGDFWGYAELGAFLIAIVIVFNSLSRLVKLISNKDADDDSFVAVARVAQSTIVLLGAYALVVFFDAYLMFNLYGGY